MPSTDQMTEISPHVCAGFCENGLPPDIFWRLLLSHSEYCIQQNFYPLKQNTSTVFSRSKDPFSKATYDIKWVTTSWTDDMIMGHARKRTQIRPGRHFAPPPLTLHAPGHIVGFDHYQHERRYFF